MFRLWSRPLVLRLIEKWRRIFHISFDISQLSTISHLREALPEKM